MFMPYKPRVAIVTPGTYPIASLRSSSVEQSVAHLGFRLRDHIRLRVYGSRTLHQPRYQTINGVQYERPVARGSTKAYVSAVIRVLRHDNPEIIQIENRPRYVKRFKSWFPKRQVWLSLHSTTFISPTRIRPSVLHGALSNADRIIVNSYFLKAYIVQNFPRFSEKIKVNRLGVDMNQFVSRFSAQGQHNRDNLRAKLGYEQKKIMLYVGRLIEKKGVHHLLQAMPQIIAQHPEALLVIVGSADYGKNALTPYVQSLHATGNQWPHNVRFIPYVPHNQVQHWYSIADIAVVPSFAEEAFGLVNVEAMASGVPVIATSAGGMKELVMDGETGFLIPLDNVPQAIAEKAILLFNDPLLAQSMSEASILRVATNFTWDHSARRLASWYTTSVKRMKRR
jgi:spore coat protein SA